MVYIVLSYPGVVKVGYTRNVVDRVRTLCGYYPELAVIALLQGEWREERHVQNELMMAGFHMQGEHFQYHECLASLHDPSLDGPRQEAVRAIERWQRDARKAAEYRRKCHARNT